MKLAEALQERADLNRNIEQLRKIAETGVDEVEAIIKKKEPAMA